MPERDRLKCVGRDYLPPKNFVDTDFPGQPQALKKAALQLHTDLNELTKLLVWFEQFKDSPISEKIWLHCQTAIAEGFTNAVRHAHKDRTSDTPIEIQVTKFPQSLEIRIWDHGDPFDLEQQLQNQPTPDLFATGGRGLRIMKELADQVTYTRTEDQRNCLLLIKHFIETLY